MAFFIAAAAVVETELLVLNPKTQCVVQIGWPNDARLIHIGPSTVLEVFNMRKWSMKQQTAVCVNALEDSPAFADPCTDMVLDGEELFGADAISKLPLEVPAGARVKVIEYFWVFRKRTAVFFTEYGDSIHLEGAFS